MPIPTAMYTSQGYRQYKDQFDINYGNIHYYKPVGGFLDKPIFYTEAIVRKTEYPGSPYLNRYERIPTKMPQNSFIGVTNEFREKMLFSYRKQILKEQYNQL